MKKNFPSIFSLKYCVNKCLAWKKFVYVINNFFFVRHMVPLEDGQQKLRVDFCYQK